MHRVFATKMTVCALILATLSGVCVSTAARAQQVTTSDQARQLSRVFGTLLDDQKRVIVPKLGVTLIYDGQINIEQTERYFAITLPHIKALHPDGRVFDLGMISINAQPTEVAGRWKMAIALPTPMRMLDEKDEPVMNLKIGNQTSKGLWDERLKGFMNFEGRYSDLKIYGANEQFSLTIPNVSIDYDFSDNMIHIKAGEMSFDIPRDILFAAPDTE